MGIALSGGTKFRFVAWLDLAEPHPILCRKPIRCRFDRVRVELLKASLAVILPKKNVLIALWLHNFLVVDAAQLMRAFQTQFDALGMRA